MEVPPHWPLLGAANRVGESDLRGGHGSITAVAIAHSGVCPGAVRASHAHPKEGGEAKGRSGGEVCARATGGRDESVGVRACTGYGSRGHNTNRTECGIGGGATTGGGQDRTAN